MKSGFKIARALVWITQLGLSVAVPPVVFIWAAVWLRDSLGLGGWIVAVGVLVGVLGAAGGLTSSLKSIKYIADSEDAEHKSVSFNDHE